MFETTTLFELNLVPEVKAYSDEVRNIEDYRKYRLFGSVGLLSYPQQTLWIVSYNNNLIH